MEIYIPGSDRIIHNTSVDFGKRGLPEPIHIVQYDTGIPILAVSLYFNGDPYVIPVAAQVNIRLGKKRDRTFVYNPALGCDENRSIAYFEVTNQMTVFKGRVTPIIEVTIGEHTAGSSYIELEIDRNPIQENYIESSTEFITLREFAERAETASGDAVGLANDAERSAAAALLSEENAFKSAEATGVSEINALGSETKAKNYAISAEQQKNIAKDAADDAERFAGDASDSEIQANSSAIAANVSEGKAFNHAKAAGVSETNAFNSAKAAGVSETNALSSAGAAAKSALEAFNSAQKAEITDVGLLRASLINNKVYYYLKDPEGNDILADDGTLIEGTAIFVNAQDAEALRQKIEVLEILIMAILGENNSNRIESIINNLTSVSDKLNIVEQHAIMDSDY